MASNRDKIKTIQFDSPLGTITAAANNMGLILVSFNDSEVEAKSIDTQYENIGFSHLEMLQIQLKEYFSGIRNVFELALQPTGTSFQQKVWSELKNIPYGETCSYQQQANILGDPKAIRAVASANGKNHIAIIIPCHRVIGSNGSLTGYAGGLWRKKWLLEHEAKHSCQSYQSELGL